MKYFLCNKLLLYVFGLNWYLFQAKFIARPKDIEAVVGENVTLTWDYEAVQWETARKGRILFGLVNQNGTEFRAILVKIIQYMQLGELQSVVLKNPVTSSDDSEFSSLRNRSSSVKDPTAQFTISNLSMHDSKKYFCQLKLGHNAWAGIRSYVTLKVVDLILDKEQSSTEVNSWIEHRVSLKCSVRAAPGARPSFSWKRNRNSTSVLQANHDRRTQSVLEVLTSANEHFGSYFCIASTPQSRVELEIPIRKLEKPEKVTNFDLQHFTNKTGKYVRLFWSPPSNDGGAPVLNYIVKYKQRTNPLQGWSMAEREKTKIPQIVLKQMNPNVDMYDVRVMARTKVGHGETLEYVLNFAPPIKAKFTSSPSTKRLFVGEDALFEWTYSVHPPDGIRDVTFGVIYNKELHGIVIKKITHSKHQVAPIIKNGDPSYPISWFQTRMTAVQNRPASFALFNVTVNDTGFFYCKLNLKTRSLTNKVYLKVDDVKIDKKNSTFIVESWMGNEIRATCAIRVAPNTKPVFSWSRVSDNKTISKGNHVDTKDKSFLMFVTNTPQDFNASGFLCTVRTPSTTVRHVVRIKRIYEPMAPTGLRAIKYNHPKRGRIVILSWSPPSDKGKTPITRYVVEYRTPGDKWRGTILKETERPEFEISAVGEDSQQYHVRVQAVNKVGKGPPSEYIVVSFDPAPKVRSRSKNRSNELSSCFKTLIGAWVLFIATNKVNEWLV